MTTLAIRSSDGEKTYTVLLGPDGAASCTCRGYEQYGHCRHLDEAREQMSETTALVPIRIEPSRTILPTKEELSIIGTIAKTVVGARGHAVPKDIDSPAKAAAVMLAGHELGVKPMTALRHIYVVNGRTEPDALIMAGIVAGRERDSTIEIVALDDDKCTMRLTRPSKGPNARWEYTYYLADAKKAGLLAKDGPWQRFPKDMMRWAATKRLCRVYAGDLINNVGYDVGAGDALIEPTDYDDADGDYVDVEALPVSELYNQNDVPAGADPDTGEILDDGATRPAAEDPGEAKGRGVVDSSGPEATAASPPEPDAIAGAIADYWARFLKAAPDVQRSVGVDVTKQHGWTIVDHEGSRLIAPVEAIKQGKGTADERAALLQYLESCPL